MDYSKLVPAPFDDKDLIGMDWIETFFDRHDGSYSINRKLNTFVGFIGGKYEVRIHFSANCLTVEFIHCTPPQEIINEVVEFFDYEEMAKQGVLCHHWKEAPNTLVFQYYHEPDQAKNNVTKSSQPSNKQIDWEQRRYEIAKDMLCSIFTSLTSEVRCDRKMAAVGAVDFADALIEELKNETCNE